MRDTHLASTANEYSTRRQRRSLRTGTAATTWSLDPAVTKTAADHAKLRRHHEQAEESPIAKSPQAFASMPFRRKCFDGGARRPTFNFVRNAAAAQRRERSFFPTTASRVGVAHGANGLPVLFIFRNGMVPLVGTMPNGEGKHRAGWRIVRRIQSRQGVWTSWNSAR
jgi:hypothetical protein